MILRAAICSGAHAENRPMGIFYEVGHNESGQTAKNRSVETDPTHPPTHKKHKLGKLGTEIH